MGSQIESANKILPYGADYPLLPKAISLRPVPRASAISRPLRTATARPTPWSRKRVVALNIEIEIFPISTDAVLRQ